MNLRKDKKTVHMAIALDESGSMAGTKKETISGLNEQLQELKKTSSIDSTVTLVTFAGPTDIKVIHSVKPISEVKELTDEDYNPNGGTAMYDGVGRLLNEIQQKVTDDDNTTYLVLVVSDGEENSSREYNSQKVADLIKERLNTKRWSINYIGANQDLTQVTKTLGIDLGNSYGYKSNIRGTQAMWDTTKNCTNVYLAKMEKAITPDAVFAANVEYFDPNALKGGIAVTMQTTQGSTTADTKVTN